jgi:hypothetical protein
LCFHPRTASEPIGNAKGNFQDNGLC